MAKVKTVLLSIFIAVLALTVLLFLVQFVDSLVNGKTYQSIDRALTSYNQAVAVNQQKCLKDYYDILNNTQFKILKDSKVKLDSKYTSPQIYTDTIDACKGIITDIDNVKAPSNLSAKKKALFTELFKLKKANTQVYIDKLEAIKSCGSNNACYTKKDNLLGKDPFKSAILSYKSTLTEMNLTRKLTVSYMVSGIFNEIFLNNQLKNIEKSKATYDQMEAQRAEVEKQAKEKPKEASKPAAKPVVKTPATPEPAAKTKK